MLGIRQGSLLGSTIFFCSTEEELMALFNSEDSSAHSSLTVGIYLVGWL